MRIEAQPIAAGFSAPVFAASPPGDSRRFFIVKSDIGRVSVLDLSTGLVAAQPFFQVPSSEISLAERGLLGLAFHPQYATNGKVYLNLTNELGDTEIWEVTRGLAGSATAQQPSSRSAITRS